MGEGTVHYACAPCAHLGHYKVALVVAPHVKAGNHALGEARAVSFRAGGRCCCRL